MKKLIVIALMVILIITMLGGSVMAASQPGPAPNSHDGVSDGAGWEEFPGQEGGKGPAPNSGDGIPDGSGF